MHMLKGPNDEEEKLWEGREVKKEDRGRLGNIVMRFMFTSCLIWKDDFDVPTLIEIREKNIHLRKMFTTEAIEINK